MNVGICPAPNYSRFYITTAESDRNSYFTIIVRGPYYHDYPPSVLLPSPVLLKNQPSPVFKVDFLEPFGLVGFHSSYRDGEGFRV